MCGRLCAVNLVAARSASDTCYLQQHAAPALPNYSDEVPAAAATAVNLKISNMFNIM